MNWVIIALLILLWLEVESLKRQRIVIVRKPEPQPEEPSTTVESDVIDEIDELLQTETEETGE